MPSPEIYQQYCSHLLQGNKSACAQIVNELLDSNIGINELYTEVFQKSLYHVGELWERNEITVAREHLVTAITESLLHLAFPRICRETPIKSDKIAVISCTPNEYHQVGGKMIADIFELQGWDSHFLGADTPLEQMLRYIDEVEPDVVGLSLSIYLNLPELQNSVHAIRSNFRKLDILVGGQAFQWLGVDQFTNAPGVNYVASIEDLEKMLKGAHVR